MRNIFRRLGSGRKTCGRGRMRLEVQRLESRLNLGFLAPLPFETGLFPISVAVADFNGDGRPDVATGNLDGDDVSVLLGNGNGTFQAPRNYATGMWTVGVEAGDVNSDGRADLAVASMDGGVFVFRFNTDGTLQGSWAYYGQSGYGDYSHMSAALGDVNGDRRLDLAFNNDGNDTVGLMLGNGDGTFQAEQRLPAGYNPSFVTMRDANRDGRLDLVTASSSSNCVGVMLGNGDGTFQAPRISPAGSDNWGVAVGDVSGDGYLDFAVAHYYANTTLGVMLGNGDGTFQTPRNYNLTGSAGAVTMGDVNRDGRLDLVTNSSVLLGNGNGTFQPAQNLPSGSYGGLAVADVNGDGWLDVVTTSFVMLNDGVWNPTGNLLSTTTTVASSANPSVYGQAVTFTATVTADSPADGQPTGTVTFKDGPTVVGTGTLDASAVATFSTLALGVGTHSITAVYNGDVNFSLSTSTALTQTVNPASKATTTTSLSSSPNPSVFGQLVTFTAIVTAGAGTPTGTVTFKDGATPLSTALLSGGQAQFITSSLSVGSHTITVAYGGDANFTASASTALTQRVTKASSTTGLTSLLNPSVYGQSVTFTAQVGVMSPGAGTPTGTVTFKDGSTTLGTGTLNTSGVATFSTTGALSVATHSITAIYNGDTNFSVSTSTALTQTVNQASTATTLTASANPSVYGQAVTFTAKVAAVSPGAGTPSGTVTFSNGMTILGIRALDASGMAALTISTLPVGSYWISASYAPGTTNYGASTAPVLTQKVNQASSMTSLTSSANPSVYRQPVTFTATVTAVSPGAGIPAGTVTFRDGRTVLGTRALDASGMATFTTSSLRVGSHSITAVYGGSANYRASTSASLAQTVSRTSTSISLTSSANPSVPRRAVTYTAIVAASGPGAGTPTGMVTFRVGSTVLGTRRLNARGMATLTARWWRGGSRVITVVYQGNANYRASTSAMLAQFVRPS